MTLRLYNTLTRRKEAFKPVEKGMVRMYNCGPTVYDYAHIGNFRAYIVADLLRRYFLYKGLKVRQVMNITDVDDKTIRASKQQGVTLKEYTDKYTKAFFEDLSRLNVVSVEYYPRATEHIKEMIGIVKSLMEKGFAYKAKDGIYFDISKFADYGKFAHLDMKGLKAGARVKQDSYDKERVNDFALWKFWDEDDGDVFWETEIGKGRPGWHIECSAMSSKYLGQPFDIHTGGVDLIFPHHQNEIAQSEAYKGVRFVNYWVHNEHLIVEGRKMSKSLGNFLTLRDLLARGYDPRAIRYVLLNAHYRQKLDFTYDSVDKAKVVVNRLAEFTDRLGKGKDKPETESVIKKAVEAFGKAMDDDLNIAEALAAVFRFVKDVNKTGGGKLAYEAMKGFDGVLGLGLSGTDIWHKPGEAPEEIKDLILKREEYRGKKMWANADKARDDLKKKGYALEDTEDGPRWKKA